MEEEEEEGQSRQRRPQEAGIDLKPPRAGYLLPSILRCTIFIHGIFFTRIGKSEKRYAIIPAFDRAHVTQVRPIGGRRVWSRGPSAGM